MRKDTQCILVYSLPRKSFVTTSSTALVRVIFGKNYRKLAPNIKIEQSMDNTGGQIQHCHQRFEGAELHVSLSGDLSRPFNHPAAACKQDSTRLKSQKCFVYLKGRTRCLGGSRWWPLLRNDQTAQVSKDVMHISYLQINATG